VRVFVAASAAAATEAALQTCEPKLAAPPVVVAASSSTLARQIEQGAPADLFVSANPRWMDHLERAGRVVPERRRDLLANRLVVVAPAGAPAPRLGPTLDLLPALGEGRLAVGDPDHVPAGLYAAEALQTLGRWAALEPRLARAADVRAALVLVERGEAPLGIVYATDAAASDRVEVVAQLPPAAHSAVVYPLGMVHGAPERPGGELAWRCLQDDGAQAVFADHGFLRP
jgi:molybdate transport system substrate-binding protein